MSKNLVQPERKQKIWRLRVVYWISKEAQARACAPTATPLTPPPPTQKYVILTAFHGKSGFVKVRQCYVTRTLTLLFTLFTTVKADEAVVWNDIHYSPSRCLFHRVGTPWSLL
jgi:hypothetical protein